VGYNGLNPTCCERSLDGYGSRCKDGDRRSHARRPRVHFPTSGPSPSYRQQVMDDWRRDLSSLDRSSPAWRSCEPPDGSSPLPFIRGVLSSRSRRLFSAAIQLTTRHSFDANYSAKFRPTADDNTTCPCSHEEGPGGLRRASKSYNINYILFRCPLSSQRQAIFGATSSLAFIFGPEDGGRKLREFLHAIQTLLRPCPRPDPPEGSEVTRMRHVHIRTPFSFVAPT